MVGREGEVKRARREMARGMSEHAEHPQPQHRQRSPEEIRDSIQSVRVRMDEALGELEHRLAPRSMAERTWKSVRNRFEDNPVPLSLIGAGLAWLAYERIGGGQGRGGEISYGAYGYATGPSARYPEESPSPGGEGSQAQGARERAEGAVEGSREAVGKAGEAVREKASSLGSASRERAGAMTERMGHEASRVGRRAEHTVQENPLGTALALFGVGLAASMMIPTTRREERMIGPTSDRVTERAKEYGKQVTEEAKDVASSAVEGAREKAGDRVKEKTEGTRAKEKIAAGMRSGSETERPEGRPRSE